MLVDVPVGVGVGVRVEVGVGLVDVGVGVWVTVGVSDGVGKEVVVKLWVVPTVLVVASRATVYHSYSVLFNRPDQVTLASDPDGTVTVLIRLKSGDCML